mmetsp:Transcript_3869/g.11557  ORF Transcript_3869/g.11557 Transcript_3869/m.11557 type:complete len:225 (+) Transcript_3869:188-862(+)
MHAGVEGPQVLRRWKERLLKKVSRRCQADPHGYQWNRQTNRDARHHGLVRRRQNYAVEHAGRPPDDVQGGKHRGPNLVERKEARIWPVQAAVCVCGAGRQHVCGDDRAGADHVLGQPAAAFVLRHREEEGPCCSNHQRARPLGGGRRRHWQQHREGNQRRPAQEGEHWHGAGHRTLPPLSRRAHQWPRCFQRPQCHEVPQQAREIRKDGHHDHTPASVQHILPV